MTEIHKRQMALVRLAHEHDTPIVCAHRTEDSTLVDHCGDSRSAVLMLCGAAQHILSFVPDGPRYAVRETLLTGMAQVTVFGDRTKERPVTLAALERLFKELPDAKSYLGDTYRVPVLLAPPIKLHTLGEDQTKPGPASEHVIEFERQKDYYGDWRWVYKGEVAI